jgi:glycosyltransferase involved in cell wall biosynthesis
VNCSKAAGKPLSILAPTRYPWRFNSPRRSRHHITRRTFVPFNILLPEAEGVTILNPLPPKRFDLVHAFNRIPIGMLPYVIGFESHLPRGFGIERTQFYRLMANHLASDRCRRIIAISDFARRMFLKKHERDSRLEQLRAKLEVRYPNLPVEPQLDLEDRDAEPVRLLFVGNHFGRKGGCVAVKIAQLAQRRRLPLQIEIISSLEVGAVAWADPTQPGYFDEYFALTNLPNVTLYPKLPNDQVLSRMRRSHFVLLPTFSDTFGYSAIEAMAQGTPVVATRQGALPEFVDDSTGIVLDLPVDADGEWIRIRDDRSTSAFAAHHRAEVHRMAEEALERIMSVAADSHKMSLMRHATWERAKSMFSADAASDYWDDLYDRSINT